MPFFFLPLYTDVKTSTLGADLPSTVVLCRLFMIPAGQWGAAEVTKQVTSGSNGSACIREENHIWERGLLPWGKFW